MNPSGAQMKSGVLSTMVGLGDWGTAIVEKGVLSSIVG